MRRWLLCTSLAASLAGCLSGEGYIVIEAQGEGSDLPDLPDPHGPDGMDDMDMGEDAGAGPQLDSGPSMEMDSGSGGGTEEMDSGMDGMEMAWHRDAGAGR